MRRTEIDRPDSTFVDLEFGPDSSGVAAVAADGVVSESQVPSVLAASSCLFSFESSGAKMARASGSEA